jgi:hypothetical protein
MIQISRLVALLLFLAWTPQIYGQTADGNAGAPSKPAAATPPSEPKRILDLIPNFTTTDDVAGKQAPLTTRHKFVLAFDQSFDISAHLGNLLQASIQQASNGQPHYHSISFGKRMAAAEADQITSCMFIYGVFPTLLHADPRYFRRDSGSAKSRLWYAVSRTFVSRNDEGHKIFNVPQLAGQLVQAGLSNLYYPPQDRGVNGTMMNWGMQLGYNSAFNVVKEFYPDVIEALHRHKMQPSK